MFFSLCCFLLFYWLTPLNLLQLLLSVRVVQAYDYITNAPTWSILRLPGFVYLLIVYHCLLLLALFVGVYLLFVFVFLLFSEVSCSQRFDQGTL